MAKPLIRTGIPFYPSHATKAYPEGGAFALYVCTCHREETIMTREELEFIMSKKYRKEYPTRAAVGDLILEQRWDANKNYQEGLKRIIS